MSGIKQGFGFASMAIGMVAAALGLFNASVDFFSLDLAPITEPIYQVVAIMPNLVSEWTANLPGWTKPRVGMGIYVALSPIIYLHSSAFVDFSINKNRSTLEDHVEHHSTKIMLFLIFYLGSLIPRLHWTFIIVAILLPIMTYYDTKGLEGQSTARSQLINTSLYLVGAYIGFATLLALNYYY
ncbi:hypothetical protein [Oceanicaulis sp.]|uniref:hypothetical protein n=1 Tax=Oceanicaulis sp. TaxID=1924941 RepID=UPI003F71C140